MKLIPKYLNPAGPLRAAQRSELITAPWVPKKITKDDYMQTDKGKVVNFQLPEITVPGKSPTGDPLKDANLYGAYRGRRYYRLGMEEARPLAVGLAALTSAPAFTGIYPAVTASMNNPFVLGAFTIDGLRNAASDNGVAKTYNYLKNGEYGKAAISGIGDFLDISGGYGILKTGTKAGIKAGKNIERRAVETFMRTTSNSNPLPEIEKGLKNIAKEDPKRFGYISKYIITGKHSNTEKGYYNSLAYPHYLYYTGFWGNPNKGNDLIDAYLYQKTIDPEFGVHKLNTKDFGPHLQYVNTNYPDKNILVYKTNSPKDIDRVESSLPWEGAGEESEIFKDAETGISVDAGGHLILNGYVGDQRYTRGQDIWKFNPEDYIKRYETLAGQSLFKKTLIKLGLKVVNNLGTPVITKTPWIKQ